MAQQFIQVSLYPYYRANQGINGNSPSHNVIDNISNYQVTETADFRLDTITRQHINNQGMVSGEFKGADALELWHATI